jgi:hypothetical protein
MTISSPPEQPARWWQRWAVLEGALGVELHWVISFHTFRRRAAAACGRRIVELTARGVRHENGIYTCVMPGNTGAVRQALRTVRTR